MLQNNFLAPSRQLIAILSVAALLMAFSAPSFAEDACESESYGAGVDVQQSLAVADLLESPADYDGQTVRVEGTVQDVCRMAGCWMEIVPESNEESAPIKVKVPDGEIVFPVSTLGHRAVAQGTVSVKELDRDAYVKYQEHLADEQKRDFDASSIGDGPFQQVQILGTGAEICVD